MIPAILAWQRPAQPGYPGNWQRRVSCPKFSRRSGVTLGTNDF
jgi:hypothetical protein